MSRCSSFYQNLPIALFLTATHGSVYILSNYALRSMGLRTHLDTKGAYAFGMCSALGSTLSIHRAFSPAENRVDRVRRIAISLTVALASNAIAWELMEAFDPVLSTRSFSYVNGLAVSGSSYLMLIGAYGAFKLYRGLPNREAIHAPLIELTEEADGSENKRAILIQDQSELQGGEAK